MSPKTFPISTIIPSHYPVIPYVAEYQPSAVYQFVTSLRELQIEGLKHEIGALAVICKKIGTGYGAARIQKSNF